MYLGPSGRKLNPVNKILGYDGREDTSVDRVRHEEVVKGGRHIKRVRMVDVGRKGHHYLEVDVLTGVGPRGGKTVAHLVTKKALQKRAGHMRHMHKLEEEGLM